MTSHRGAREAISGVARVLSEEEQLLEKQKIRRIVESENVGVVKREVEKKIALRWRQWTDDYTAAEKRGDLTQDIEADPWAGTVKWLMIVTSAA